MISYKDDPKLKLQVVTTVTGDKEYRRNCKNIGQKYYVIDKDCFLVEGKWYRVESGKIEFDHEKKVWHLKTKNNLSKGVVGIGPLGAFVYGQFTPNIYNNCKVYDRLTGNNVLAINSEVLQTNGYFEDIATNIWYYSKEMTSNQIKKMQSIRNEVNFQNKAYNIEDNAVEFDQKKESYANFPTVISKEARAYGKLLGDTTFGAEIETSEGNLPNSAQYRMGLVGCRDGSINSAEWVTVPMAGAKGVQNLVDVSEVVSARCNIDINCSLHYHFGNIPKSREYLVALYTLAYKMQDDVFKMFPYFKTDHRGIKKKNYCQKLKKMSIYVCKDLSKEGYDTYINEMYVRIFTFLSDGTPPGENANRKRQQHPIQNKWDRKSRYFWLNLQNMIFSERETAEFRLHTATTNKVKMISWLFMCNAIVKYAEANLKEIITNPDKISFTKVLKYYESHFPDNKIAKYLSDYLISYYESRCVVFAKDFERSDFLSEHDIKSDKKFDFVYDGLKLL
jgi:hypothetical protein